MNARLLVIVVVGAALYVATLVAVPILNPDLDVLRLHPEDYASANAGILVNVGYVALALALVALAIISAGRGGVAGWVAALAFAAAAITCAANAIDPNLGTRRSVVEYGVFGLVIGPLVLSLASRERGPLVLATAVLLAFVALLAAGDGVGGLVNRVFDAVVGLWCVVFASSRARRGIMRGSGEVA